MSCDQAQGLSWSTPIPRVKKQPRYEVISVRTNPERLALLKRYQHALADQLGRRISIAEAAFLVIEGRAIEMDRTATRHEMLQTPTASLDRIRKRWTSQHTLVAAEWDVLAEYAQIAADTERPEACRTQPTIPLRDSYRALLDVFEWSISTGTTPRPIMIGDTSTISAATRRRGGSPATRLTASIKPS